jgi:2'-hydroxyisoflavone reductase
MGELLETCRAVAGGDARLVWVDEEFLLEREVGQWMELPLWVAERENGFLEVASARAVAAGLTFRSLEATVRDTLAWARADGATAPLASGMQLGEAGLRAERERELLDAWASRQAA